MEQIYWISDGTDRRLVNDHLAQYGGHVTMISAAATTEDQDYAAHAFVVVEFPDDHNPRTDS